MKSNWSLWLFAISSLLLSGCDRTDGRSSLAASSTDVAVLEGISITPATTQIPVGLSQQLTATGTYSDGSSRDISAFVFWESGHPAVATVDLAGLVTAVSPGESQVTARTGNLRASAPIVATRAGLQSLSITPETPSIPAGLHQPLFATGLYSDGSTHDMTSTVVWTSRNTSVATVNEHGITTAVQAGFAAITARTGGISRSVTLEVTPAVLQSIAVAPGNKKLPVGVNIPLTATGAYSDGSKIDITDQVTWTSSDDRIAFVDHTGLATTVAQGDARITARHGNTLGSAMVTVTSAELVSIAVLPADATVSVGETLKFAAIGTYSDASTLDISDLVSWHAVPNAIGPVDENGLATGRSPGAASIKAFVRGVKGRGTLTVLP